MDASAPLPTTPTVIALSAVIDHARAEAAAARIRAAVRNGKRHIDLVLSPDAVINSSALLAYLIRARDLLRNEGGRLAICGEDRALEQLRILGFTVQATSQGPQS